MNGQPTAQNTRECGVNGEFVASATGRTPSTSPRLARIWNVEPSKLPTWTPPTHAMQMFQLAETGSIRFLWIIATNPAVIAAGDWRGSGRSSRKRTCSSSCQDAFLTETAAAGRRRPARGDLGREDRLHDQRRPHGPPLRQGGRAARRGAIRPGDLPRLCPADGLPEQGRRAADPVDRQRRRLRGLEGVQRGPPLRLLRDELRDADGAARASSGHATRATRRVASGSTRMASSIRRATIARPMATTSPRAPRSRPRSTPPGIPRVGP